MSEKDKLFTFMEGLKPWARLELQRQRVTDLGSAMAAAERLTDFNPEGRRDRQTDAWSCVARKDYGATSICEWRTRIRKKRRTTWAPSPNGATRCPKWRQRSWCHHMQERLPRLLLRASRKEEAQPRNPRKKGLMFVDVKIHGKPIRAMIDTGATHNYLASAEVERLGLVLGEGSWASKGDKLGRTTIAGVAKSVLIKVGSFEGKTNLSVVVMDDFKLILGLEFLRDTREKNLSAMQFEKGRKRNEPSYLCTLRFDEIEETSGPIPGRNKEVAERVRGRDARTSCLGSFRRRGQWITKSSLVPGTKPPARAPYRMSQPELVELRKQLKDMLESGIIKTR
ncbi:UNVERIFIED_CONTAM: hypothetical protein Sindi_3026700 [Sesamum indicum]